MQFHLFALLNLFFLSTLEAQTILSRNTSSHISDIQAHEITEQISSLNPDLVCLRANNANALEQMLSSSHPYLFYDQGLLVASKASITDLQFSPFLETNEGILELITADSHIYIPIFNDPNDQVLWELAYQKIWNDHDPFSLLCTQLNSISQLQKITFVVDRQSETTLCGGPASTNFMVKDAEGNYTVGVEGRIETETSNGSKVEFRASAEATRDSQGNVSKEARAEIKYTPSAK